jgi:hypothetical protein
MNDYIQAAKVSIVAHKKEYMIGAGVVLGSLALIIAIIALFVQNGAPKIDYQPAAACDLFTAAEAKTLLGARALNSTSKSPVISGNTAVSNCGYTDGSTDTENMIVAAMTVRSGINDKGVEQNKTEFSVGRPHKNVEIVKDLGDNAYFNQTLGQLNILDGRKWIILSYGVGSTPEANTVDKAVELARKIIDTAPVTSSF